MKTAELRALLESTVNAMTQAPWVAERSFADADTVHWSIRTVEKMPDTPWSPRFVAWMTGALRHGVSATYSPYRFCEHCKRGYLQHREAGVDVRTDVQAEADVQGIATLRNLAPLLVEALGLYETVSSVLNTTYTDCLTPLAEAFGFTGPELDDSFVDHMKAAAGELATLRERVAFLERQRDDLQAANTREVERRRAAEQKLSEAGA